MSIRKMLTTATLFAVLALLGVVVSAQDSKKSDLADINNEGSSVSWRTNVNYESVKLTVVAPNGTVYSQLFKAGAIPTYTPVVNRGNSYVNGSFKYELVFTPVLSPGVKQALEQARIDGNSEAVSNDLKKRGLLEAPMIESGSFLVFNGTITTKNDPGTEPQRISSTETKIEPSETTTKDGAGDVPVENFQTINDDLSVIGSTCTGQDCVTGETFGFDTLRLKENNLRINFQDTSSTASFPTADWRIVANDTTNGGASYLSFEDSDAGTTPFKVEAGAGNNALVVTDSGGNVGLGTATPVVELQITDGDSPTIRIEQNGASGFTAQTWDIAGNETNFFVRDVTNGSTLPFKIQPGAQTGTVNLGTGGNVGIGFNNNNFSTNPLEVRNGGNTLAIVNTAGELSLPKSGGGIRFSDGSLQTTASTGGGGGSATFLGPNYSSGYVAGAGAFDPTLQANATVDFNKGFVQVTSGTVANVQLRFNILSNANLTNTTADYVVYKIRFQDSDGSGVGARVRLVLYSNALNGGQSSDLFFDSQTQPATGAGFAEATVCRPGTSLGDFANRVHYIDAFISNFNAAQQAGLAVIQMYKSTTCP